MEKDHQINNAGGSSSSSSNPVEQNSSKLKAPNFDTKQNGADVNKVEQKPAVLLIDPVKHKPVTSKPVVWDCGSTLYDSFELNSFKRQLDMALNTASNHIHKDSLLFSEDDELGPAPTRTHSMPHLSHSRHLPITTTDNNFTPPTHPTKSTQKPNSSSSKLSRSFTKLLRSLIPKSSSSNPITPTKPATDTPLSTGKLDDNDRKDITRRQATGAAARWILVYEDDIIYNKAIEVGESGLTTSLSTIPEAPDEVVNNYVDEEKDTPKLCRRLSSSSLGGRRRTMSFDRFTTINPNCRSSDPFSFLSSCTYRQKQQ